MPAGHSMREASPVEKFSRAASQMRPEDVKGGNVQTAEDVRLFSFPRST